MQAAILPIKITTYGCGDKNMKTEIWYWSIKDLEKFKPLKSLILEIKTNKELIKIVDIEQSDTLSTMEEKKRKELIERLANNIYPIYFYVEMPHVWLEEFEQLFINNNNEYLIINRSEYCTYIFLKVYEENNFEIVIKELAWVNASGFLLVWSTNPNLFRNLNKENSILYLEENTSIFSIGSPEQSIVIITNESRFSSYEKIVQFLPSFVEPTFSK